MFSQDSGMSSYFVCGATIKKLTSFNGNELSAFVHNILSITEFIESHFDSSDETSNIVRGLILWKEIYEFVSISVIETSKREQYISAMTKNNDNVKEFYQVGATSFLTGGTQTGDQETFYMHVMRFYIPEIARITYDRHRLGVGIFNMQGFERRNKESKNTLRRFTNNKGNVVLQNLKRLWDIFYHNRNMY